MGYTNELRKFVAPELIFGEGALGLVGRYAANFMARRVLLVTDPGVRAAGWSGEVEAQLRQADIPYVVFDGLTPNPKVEEVMAGAGIYRSEGCDVIVAVGGGSVTDCAKGIGIASTNCFDPKDPDRFTCQNILDFEGIDEIPVPGPPLICAPTTAGSSADVSQFAIITDSARRVKAALISKLLVPDVALVDPITTTTLPPDMTAAVGLDVLVHAMEAYVSNASSSVTDLHALEAVRLVAAHLTGAVAFAGEMDHLPMDHLSGMMSASMHAGLAFSNASLGLVHGMAHSLGGLLDLPHGVCNAILFEHVIPFNFPAAPERYSRIAEAMGLTLDGYSEQERLEALTGAIARLRRSVGIDYGLAQAGVTRADLPLLARNALNDPCLATNPLRPTLEDIEEIYERAL